MSLERTFMAFGAVSGLVAVALGAFAAHALRDRLTPELTAVFETGVRYQMYHALALLIVALAVGRAPTAQLIWAGWMFTGGTVIFSGSLYALALTGTRWFGAITPLGGIGFLIGWLLIVWSALERSS